MGTSNLDEVRNRWPGFPPRPVTGGGLPGLLGTSYRAEPKADGHRVILVHGLAFNRHGGLYSKDPEGFLEGHWEALTDLFPARVFDLEYFPHGDNRGNAILLDLNVSSIKAQAFWDYHARRKLMESGLPQCDPVMETWGLANNLCIVPSIQGGAAANEFYEGLKAMYQEALDPGHPPGNTNWIWEGVVMKYVKSTYKTTRSQSDNKTDWIKYRFR
jgi:hypothetical protein